MIGTVVLAAGGASRFGSPKLLAQWFGRPLVEHALEIAPAEGPKIAVVGKETVALRPLFAAHGFAVVRNARPSRGLASSLALALEHMPEGVAAALVLLGDQPAVSHAAVERVLEAYRRANRAVAAAYDGERGHPAILPRAVWSELPKTGDSAGRDIPVELVECGDLALGAADVDTPDELFELAARACRAPLVRRLRNEGSLDARLGLPDAFVVRSVDGKKLRTRELGEFEDEILLPIEDLKARALDYGRMVQVVARVGDEYAALVG